MTITVSTTDPRSLKALAVLETADRWHKGHTKSGRSFYAVPASTDPNGFHMVDCRECTCQDFIRRGLDCKHILAVRLYVAKLQAAPPAKRLGAKRRAPKPAAPEVETLAERETRESGGWGVRPTPPDFYTATSIGGTIQAPEAARRRCLADDVWGVDGE